MIMGIKKGPSGYPVFPHTPPSPRDVAAALTPHVSQGDDPCQGTHSLLRLLVCESESRVTLW